MTMVERVAMAIHAADDMDESYEEMKAFFDTLARAAIEAMREPTEAMYEAAWLAPVSCSYTESAHAWSAMIDAALSE